MLESTNAVVAICVVFVPAAAVGAVGVPANAGLEVTNAVVASCVVLVPAVAVGAVGMPVNAGDARNATFAESRASGSVPVVRIDALRTVMASDPPGSCVV